MFKRILTLLPLFIIASYSYAQKNITIEATIVDLVTGEALPFTNVIIENTSIGTISNEEGVFELTMSSKYAQSNVIFSFMGYQNKSVPVSKFKDPRQKVYIESASTSLDEIVVEVKNKYLEYVGEAIRQVPTNYANQPVYLDSYYRELTRIDGNYTKFTDASAALYYTPYTDPYDPQISRATYMRFDKRDTQKHSTPFPEPLDHISATGDQAKIQAVRKSDNLQQYKSLDTTKKAVTINPKDLQWLENSEIGGGPLRLSGADKMKRKMDFFHPKKHKEYRFKLLKKSNYDNRPVFVIRFEPKDTTACKVNYVGQLTMDQNSKAIIAYQYRPAPLCRNGLRQKFGTHLKTPDSLQHAKSIAFIKRTTTLTNYDVKVTYSLFDGKWYLKTIKTTNYYKNDGDLFDSYAAVTESELLVHSVRTTNVTPFPIQEVFDSTFSTTLFEYDAPYQPEYWKNYSTLVPTGIVGKALNDLESNSSLEEQFQHKK